MSKLTRSQYTGRIKAKGWLLKDALEYWGRGAEWYQKNCDGNDKARIRLDCMINGLPTKGDRQ